MTPNAPEVLCLNGVAALSARRVAPVILSGGRLHGGRRRAFQGRHHYAKKVGFNFLRIHIKIEDPLFLYYADTIGMMVMADFPNFGEGGDTP